LYKRNNPFAKIYASLFCQSGWRLFVDIHYPLFAGGLLSFVSLSEKESSKETEVVFGY